MQQTMKAAKTRPWGSAASPLESTGVQMKTKEYIEPSKEEAMIPQRRTSRLVKIVAQPALSACSERPLDAAAVELP